jgi:hypothetical protein
VICFASGSPDEQERQGLAVLVGDKRVAVSLCASEVGEILKLVLFSNDASTPSIERFTDDDGVTFRYKVFLSPETRMERDPQIISVLQEALDEWRRKRPGK